MDKAGVCYTFLKIFEFTIYSIKIKENPVVSKKTLIKSTKRKVKKKVHIDILIYIAMYMIYM